MGCVLKRWERTRGTATLAVLPETAPKQGLSAAHYQIVGVHKSVAELAACCMVMQELRGRLLSCRTPTRRCPAGATRWGVQSVVNLLHRASGCRATRRTLEGVCCTPACTSALSDAVTTDLSCSPTSCRGRGPSSKGLHAPCAAAPASDFVTACVSATSTHELKGAWVARNKPPSPPWQACASLPPAGMQTGAAAQRAPRPAHADPDPRTGIETACVLGAACAAQDQ